MPRRPVTKEFWKASTLSNRNLSKLLCEGKDDTGNKVCSSAERGTRESWLVRGTLQSRSITFIHDFPVCWASMRRRIRRIALQFATGVESTVRRSPLRLNAGTPPTTIPEGNSYIERFHRSLKEEEVWLSEYQNLGQAEHRSQDRGVQSQPFASRTPWTNPAGRSHPVRPPSLQTRPLVSGSEGALQVLFLPRQRSLNVFGASFLSRSYSADFTTQAQAFS